MMLLQAIQNSWSWTGLNAVNVTATNAFGNVLVRAADGSHWRICPEELSCDVIAGNDAEFDVLFAREDFQVDWRMDRLVEIARAALGTVDDDHCYCLKMPAVLGGKYETANFGTISRQELIAFAGKVAEQIKDLPDGTAVQFSFID